MFIAGEMTNNLEFRIGNSFAGFPSIVIEKFCFQGSLGIFNF